jgi:amino-acid N-acetyltransferase
MPGSPRNSTPSIAPATPDDLAAVLALLTRSALPTAGLDQHFHTALVARRGDRLAGCVALEIYGPSALFRSLAVDPEFRDRGLGSRLTAAALAKARRHQLVAVYLLTTTAERFFPRFGFTVIERADLPAELAASAELRGACPATAIAMGRKLA